MHILCVKINPLSIIEVLAVSLTKFCVDKFYQQDLFLQSAVVAIVSYHLADNQFCSRSA